MSGRIRGAAWVALGAGALLALAACTGAVEGDPTAEPTDKLLGADGSASGPAVRLDGGVSADSGATTPPEPWKPETICQPWAEPKDAYDQSVVPLEVMPKNASAKRVVLISQPSGHASGAHEYFAGNAMIARMLCGVPGVVPVIVKDGWAQNEAVFEGAAAIVIYANGGEGHPLMNAAHRAVVAREIARGAGFVNLHHAVEYPNSVAAEVLPWLGGRYEDGFSYNPYWEPTMQPYPAHVATRGMGPIQGGTDEWYYDMRFASSGVTPLLVASGGWPRSPKTGGMQTLAWTYARPDGGRSFGFVGGHWNDWWLDQSIAGDSRRRIVVNATLWTAGVEVPSAGADVHVDADWAGHWKKTL